MQRRRAPRCARDRTRHWRRGCARGVAGQRRRSAARRRRGRAARRRRPACPASNPPNDADARRRNAAEAQLGTPFADRSRSRSRTRTAARSRPPLAGIAVTFTAPGERRRAEPSRRAARTRVTVGTDASGQRDRAEFTANGIAGQLHGHRELRLRLGLVLADEHRERGRRRRSRRSRRRASRRPSTAATRSRSRRRCSTPTATRSQGASVTFTLGSARRRAALAGARGASFDGGSARRPSTTNATGIATSPRFTANSAAGTFTATATVAGRHRAGQLHARQPRRQAATHHRLGATQRIGDRRHRYATAAAGQGRDASRQAAAGRDRHLHARRSAAPARRERGAGASFAGGTSQATATTNAFGHRDLAPLRGEHDRRHVHRDRDRDAAATGQRASRSTTCRAGRRRSPPASAASESTTVGTRFPIRARRHRHRQARQPRRRRARHASPRRPAAPSGTLRRARHAQRVTRAGPNASGIAVAPAFTANAHAGRLHRQGDRQAAGAAAFALVNQPPAERVSATRARRRTKLRPRRPRARREHRPAHPPPARRRSRRSGSRSASPRSSPCSASPPPRRPGCSPRSTSSAPTCSPSPPARRSSAAPPSCRSPRPG